jgi:phosphohistidine swiveling domain-containing protein
MRQATIGREYAKFVFTKSVSEALILLEQFGGQFGISREEMSFLNIRTVLDLYAVLDNEDLPKLLMNDIYRNRDAYKITSAIKMPHLILNSDEAYDFFVGDSEPNFVTLKRVVGFTIREEDFAVSGVLGKVVFVPSADPGYDWLFSKGILGLVTMYGGANSHMAVRSAELGLPAVIGAGEQNYMSWVKAEVIDIDCANKQVMVIR